MYNVCTVYTFVLLLLSDGHPARARRRDSSRTRTAMAVCVLFYLRSFRRPVGEIYHITRLSARTGAKVMTRRRRLHESAKRFARAFEGGETAGRGPGTRLFLRTFFDVR